jgi:hypothetical protein
MGGKLAKAMGFLLFSDAPIRKEVEAEVISEMLAVGELMQELAKFCESRSHNLSNRTHKSRFRIQHEFCATDG